MTHELWLPVHDFPNYEVSSFGAVRRLTTNTSGRAGGVLAGYKDKDGYHCILLYANGTRRTKKAHRLVVEAFIGTIDKELCVNHKNGVKDDNRLENLEIVTLSENTMHGFRVLGRKPTVTGKVKGIKHHNSKFTDDDIRNIRRLYSQGIPQTKIAELFKSRQSHISRIIRRESWPHVS